MVAWRVCVVAAVLCAALLPGFAVGDGLSADCQLELEYLWTNYTQPAYNFDSCDSECLSECKETLETAIYVTGIKDCPLQTDITRCFKYYAPLWEEYIETCDLFKVSDSDLPAGSAAEAEGESSSSEDTTSSTSTSTADAEAEAEAAAPVPAEAEAEAEAAAPTPAEAAAEAEAPAPEADAEAEATAEPDAGRRRRLLAEAEAEAAGSSGSGICFPSFKSAEEFNMYLNGDYFTLAYDPPSDTAGIILSVFFWVGLAGMGFYLRK